ncbi:MAG: NAD-dependent epimerase/dehydratase family protein [Nanoarchaeota archaeon]
MKRLLITGCNGYLGSNLVNYLSNKNKYKIICISRKNKINFNNKGEIIKSIKNADIIIHLAAIINPFDKDIFKVNRDYTKFLVQEAKKLNKRFIYISTQNVLFGKDNYSESKRQAEIIVMRLKNYVILRPTIIYGGNDLRYIGRLIKIVKISPIVPILGDGNNELQPIYISDLIKVIEKCINKNVRGTFLIAGSSCITYNKLMDIIIKKLKVRRIKIHLPLFLVKPFAYIFERILKNPPITTVQLYNLDITKKYNINNIKKVFNIKPKTIERGINETIE